jgi:hypothetical protein
MKFTVDWTVDADSQMTEMWLQSSKRTEFTKSIRYLERLLGTNADNEGESRDGGYRILFYGPFAAYYRVSLENLQVVIASIGWSGQPE